ncbi:hypothetical protein [Geomicrobium sp. JCM 19037]|uniref:hypothetical protein n=1 Tax=Geomicrobium sp. JCM 19037 TaxID=1460634 RepID=UPI0005AAF07D|nr:hypothetical protein [Geomicrobium sp. JCM 19037]
MKDMKQKYDHCLQHVGHNVQAQMADNQVFMGLLESVDEEHVYLLVQDHSDNVDHDGMSGSYGGHHQGSHHHHGGHHGHHHGHDHHGGHHGHHHGHDHHGGHHGHHHHDHHGATTVITKATIITKETTNIMRAKVMAMGKVCTTCLNKDMVSSLTQVLNR